MSTTVTYNFSNLISGFDNVTSESNDWKIIFNDEFSGVLAGNSILSSPSSFGNKIEYDQGLKMYGSSTPLSILGNIVYSNPGKTMIKFVGDNTDMSSVVFKISEINNTTNQLYRSYDLFENISNKALEDGYSYEQTFIGLSNSNSRLGIVILKPPTKSKIRNRNLYVSRIKNIGAIGNESYVDYVDVCDSSIFSENERIIALVYEKNGKYYNLSTMKVIEDYDILNGKYSLMYTGLGGINPLMLSYIGTDGRKLNSKDIDKSKFTSKYVLDKLSSTVALNASFYPYKEENTSINVLEISKTNTLDVVLTTKIIGQTTIATISVKKPNGEILTTGNIMLDGIDYTASTSVVDFSDEHSIVLDSVGITTTTNTVDTNISTYTKKRKEPYFLNMKGTSISDVSNVVGDIILDEGYGAYILIANIGDMTTSHVVFNVKIKNGNAYSDTTNYIINNYYGYTCLELKDGVGSYKITAYVESNTADNILPSKSVEWLVSVFNKIKEPSIIKTINDLGGGRTNISVEITQEDNVDCYFSVDGDEPDMVSNTFVSKYPYPLFTFENSTKITTFAYDGLQKSQTIYSNCTVDKTVTLDAPQIFSAFNNSTNKYEITISGVGSIYYTIDGTTTNSKSNRYSGMFSVSPLVDRTITIKTKAIQSGSIDSAESSLVLEYNYACSPWKKEYGEIQVLDNSVLLSNNTLISRRIVNSNNYIMKFSVFNWSGDSELIIFPRENMMDYDNYSRQYFKNKVFSISSTYSDGAICVLNLGEISNNFDRNYFKKFGETVWNNRSTLNVEYIVRNNTHILNIINDGVVISTGEYSLKDINKYIPSIMLKNINGSNSSIRISNISINCL